MYILVGFGRSFFIDIATSSYIYSTSTNMPKHISDDKRNDAKAMLSNGKSVREVARQLGISQGTVSNIRGEMTIEISRHVGGRPGKICCCV